VKKMIYSCDELITHVVAFIILQVIEERNKKICGSVSREVGDIKHTIDANLNETEVMIEDIDKVASEMRILALNARIEAARVGDAGRGFALVAEQMSKLTDSVHEIARSMEQINGSVCTTSIQFETSMNRLK
jgi:methyl-accepting chemotaxis protein